VPADAVPALGALGGRVEHEGGERFRYLTRVRAHDIGLLPAAGTKDWWLIDGHRLIVMRFDPEGRRITNELITAPAAIEQAVTWRDLALRHSVDDVGR
jgi:hypothetical protein